MATFSKNPTDAHKCVLYILTEDRAKTWSVATLTREVGKYTGYSAAASVVRGVVITMVNDGKIGGITNWQGTNASGIHYIEPDTGGNPATFNPATLTVSDPAPLVDPMAGTLVAQLEDEVADLKVQVAAKPADRVVSIEAWKKDGMVKVTEGLFHAKFERLLKLAVRRKNILIYGPTGSGKTFTCEQIADSMDLPFYFTSCTSGTPETHMTARIAPTIPDRDVLMDNYNEFVEQGVAKAAAATLAAAMANGFSSIISEFVVAFENGGVFLLDEMDAADPNVLLVINTALANGKMAVPNRPSNPYAERHDDFICVGAANTVGTGADRMYSGRNKLDDATLDRFRIGKTYMDYDATVEAELCPDDTLRNRLLKYRDGINKNRLERSLSTRFMKDAYDMYSDGWTIEDIDESFFQGWHADETLKVKNHADWA